MKCMIYIGGRMQVNSAALGVVESIYLFFLLFRRSFRNDYVIQLSVFLLEYFFEFVVYEISRD